MSFGAKPASSESDLQRASAITSEGDACSAARRQLAHPPVTGVPVGPGVGCVTGVADSTGSGHTCVLLSQIVTLVGKLSPTAIFSGAENVPFVNVALYRTPPPSIVSQLTPLHVRPRLMKNTSPLGVTAMPNGL